jgi:hypothetical protein
MAFQADRASTRYRNGLELCVQFCDALAAIYLWPAPKSPHSIHGELAAPSQLIRKVLKLPGSIWEHNKFF